MPPIPPEYNLRILFPNVVKQWHAKKNGGEGPQDFTLGSGEKVWWLCDRPINGKQEFAKGQPRPSPSM